MLRSLLATAVRIIRLLGTALITGLTVAMLAFPVAAGLGLVVKQADKGYTSLPGDLRIAPSPQTSYLYAADGKTLITTFYSEFRRYTALSGISPWIQEAVVATEDARFFEHHGVDLRGAARAFVANNQAGQVAQGASTLTMQYVRNELRDAAPDPQSVVDATAQDTLRKVREMKLATDLERRMTKPQILEGYLNVAYFGHRAYGIFAAAQIYFAKSPADLTLPEAAMIAGLAQAPSAYDPSANPSAALTRRDYVLDRMAAIGYLSPALAERTKRIPIALRLSDPPNDCGSVPAQHNDWGFFCDEFKTWWLSQPAFGDTRQARLDKLQSGGYTIVSSLDTRIQAAGQRHVLNDAAIRSRYALGLVLVQPGTGLIKTMAVNRTYSLDQSRNHLSTDPAKARRGLPGSYPNTVNMLLGGGPTSGYQAGSTFKIFTMLAALAKGYKLNTRIYAPNRLPTRYLNGTGPASCGDFWCPSNASAAMTGVQDMWTGFGKSVNTYWVQVEQRIGAANAVAMAGKLGLTWHNATDRRMARPENANKWGAFTLGVADTTPLEMANAYATVGADGVYCQPLPVISITDPDGAPATIRGASGQDVLVAQPRCTRAVSAAVARAAADAARCPTGYGAVAGECGNWATASGAAPRAGVPLAGKTGTTDDTRSAWFIGFNRQLSGACFVADPDSPLDVVGEWQYYKPIDVVTLTIRDAMKGIRVLPFIPPPAAMVGR